MSFKITSKEFLVKKWNSKEMEFETFREIVNSKEEVISALKKYSPFDEYEGVKYDDTFYDFSLSERVESNVKDRLLMALFFETNKG